MTKNKDKTIQLTAAELEQLLEQRRAEEREAEKAAERQRRDAYESVRASVVHAVMSKVKQVQHDLKELHGFVEGETDAFREVLEEYGKLVREDQLGFTIQEGNSRILVNGFRVKRFDERSNVAAARLVEFLRKWIEGDEDGEDNAMYKLAMTLLERSKEGEFDYKNISKLYQLEADFDDVEYSEIMQLFKESHIVETNATRYYFFEKDKHGEWNRIELNFSRM